jgi:hypothetical protein
MILYCLGANDMWDNDLERAKAAIQRKDYQSAKTILEMMPDNYIARDWLAKLNRKNLKFRHEESYNSSVSSSSSLPERREIPMVAVGIIAVNMVFWALLLIVNAAINPISGQAQARTALFVAGSLVGLPILYFIFWRWFWWALAFTWLSGTIIFIVALSLGFQMPLLFQ